MKCPKCGGELIPAEEIVPSDPDLCSNTDELSLVCERGDWSADGWMGEDADDPAVLGFDPAEPEQ